MIVRFTMQRIRDPVPDREPPRETVLFVGHSGIRPIPGLHIKIIYSLDELHLTSLIVVFTGVEPGRDIARFEYEKREGQCHGNRVWPAGWGPARLAA